MFSALIDNARGSRLVWHGRLFIYWLKDRRAGFVLFALLTIPFVAIGSFVVRAPQAHATASSSGRGTRGAREYRSGRDPLVGGVEEARARVVVEHGCGHAFAPTASSHSGSPHPAARSGPRVCNGKLVAFSARSWKVIDDLHVAVLANGGAWDGAHGLRLWAFSG
jgi:hypothetical protein